MAFTFRNSTRLVDSESKVENKNGFNQFSAPGPHQGQGGQSVSLEEAKKAFSKRADSPMKKCSPITMKASPLKINEALVQGAADSAKGFVDVGDAFAEGIKKSETK
jgi:hypothetical protein